MGTEEMGRSAEEVAGDNLRSREGQPRADSSPWDKDSLLRLDPQTKGNERGRGTEKSQGH